MSLLTTRIDLDAIAHNVAYLKDKVGPGTRLMCVVKADAYGHGIEKVAPVMEAAGADAFGVATTAEAVRLRQVGVNRPIAAWIWDPSDDLSETLAHGITVGVPSLEHARALIGQENPASVIIGVETGMHRSGIQRADWPEAFELLRDCPFLEVTGLMSHFACADTPDHPHNDYQEQQFRDALEQARSMGLECPVNHLANSPATLTRPSAYFEQVRVGLACYGLEPIAGMEHDLRPAMTWAATVINVKPIDPGEATCYGLTWSASQPGYLATVPAGYADGLPRNFQDKLEVGINGHLYPQVGRVCMDQVVVDLGPNPHGVAIGDEAVLFGTGGRSATDLANAAGTINYEVVCRPTGRTQRVYLPRQEA